MREPRRRVLASSLAGALAFALPLAGAEADETLGPRVKEARALAHAGRLDAALAEYEAVLENAPETRDARLGRARVLSWLGRHGESLAALEAMQEANPEDPEALVLQARVLGWTKRFDEAEQRARDAAAIAPDFVDAHLVLGDVLAWADESDAAALAYAEARRAAPEDPRPLVAEGKLLAARGQTAEAAAAFEAALLLSPELPGAREGLRRLELTPRERRGHLAAGLRFDSLDRGLSDWWREDLQLSYRVQPRLTLFTGVTQYRRFGDDDTQGSLGISWAAPGGWWLGAGTSLGPDADVVARYTLDLEVARQAGEKAILQLRYRRSWYVDAIETDAITPGVELRPIEELKLGAYYHFTHVTSGRLGHAGSLRADVFPERPLGAYAGLSYGSEAFSPSTVQGARKQARSLSSSVGFTWRHDWGFGLRLGYAFQDLEATYRRHAIETGVWVDF